MPSVEVIQADVTTLAVDAVVNAANTRLAHGGGVAGAIVRAGGAVIQEESDRLAPIELGDAVVTTAGSLPATRVIHAATMEPGGATSSSIIEKATRSTLALAESLDCRSIALVAFGTGIGRFPLELAAGVMAEVVTAHRGESLERIIIAVRGEEAERVFRAAFESG